ncbi:MAG: helix-turn-helix transcriptional regulator [Candidatus Limnocylindrales bacterium]
MSSRETAGQRGARTSRNRRRRLGEELRQARLAAGLSQRQLGRYVRVSHSAIGRMERAEVRTLSIDRVAVVAAILGLDLYIGLYPDSSPVRDAAHLAVLERFRVRLGPGLSFRMEVQMPGVNDLRSADGLVAGDDVDVMVEAETRLDDVQAALRKVFSKQRDLGSRRVILILSDTRYHRSLVKAYPELAERFPISQRTCLRALAAAVDPGGNAILLL